MHNYCTYTVRFVGSVRLHSLVSIYIYSNVILIISLLCRKVICKCSIIITSASSNKTNNICPVYVSERYCGWAIALCACMFFTSRLLAVQQPTTLNTICAGQCTTARLCSKYINYHLL